MLAWVAQRLWKENPPLAGGGGDSTAFPRSGTAAKGGKPRDRAPGGGRRRLRSVEHTPLARAPDRARLRSVNPQQTRTVLRRVAPRVTETQGDQSEVIGRQRVAPIGDRHQRRSIQNVERLLEGVPVTAHSGSGRQIDQRHRQMRCTVLGGRERRHRYALARFARVAGETEFISAKHTQAAWCIERFG